jgi:N6-adenosine-specific RNA methylase IME4
MNLIRYDAACRALAEAHSVDEVKDIRDKAIAVQAYARQAKNTTLITQATEIRMRAERRAGELLIEMAERNERASSKDTLARGRELQPRETPKLADLGINKTQSSRWQRLAALDSESFEAKVVSAGERAYDSVTHRFLKEEKIRQAKAQHAKTIEHGCTAGDLAALTASGKRFGVIYADPPWPFATWGGDSGKIHTAVDNHYNTSTLDEIARLPVAPLAADNCALFLWCTWPHITIGTHVKIIEAWGFEPSAAAFVWVKQNPSGNGLHSGNGYCTQANTEVCFYAKKGSPLRLNADVHQVIMAPVGEHSAKPEEARLRIERLFACPYLELYSRKEAPGWTVWGNAIPRTQFVEAAE